MAALKDLSLSLESEAANRRSLALKAMATYASIATQAQGHHNGLCSIPGTLHCNPGCTLCSSSLERHARPSKHAAAYALRHKGTQALTHHANNIVHNMLRNVIIAS